jgi:hypothetical protein
MVRWLLAAVVVMGLGTCDPCVPGSSQPGQAPPALPTGAVRQFGEVQYPNVGHVLGVAFSPDGKTVAAGSWDELVRVWDVATGKELRQLSGHKAYVKGVLYSRDGKLLVTFGGDSTIRLWHGADGKPLRVIQCPGRPASCALSPNGKLLAAYTGKNLRAWEVATGKELYGHPLTYPDAVGTFSADSKEIIGLAYRDSAWVIVFRDALTGKEQRQLPTGVTSRFGGEFAQGGRKLLLCRDSTLYLYDLAGGAARKTANLPERVIESVAFSTSGRMFAYCGMDEVIHVWETNTLRERCRFRGLESGNIPLAFSPDDTLLASGSTDRTVLLWDVPGHRTGKVPAGKLTPKDLEALWSDLASADAALAYQALARLLAQPEAALGFLKERIRPAAVKIEAGLIDRLIVDLASTQYPVRNKAEVELARLGELAEPSLRKALDQNLTLEVRQRVDKLLKRLMDERADPPPERLRILRVVETLETMASPAAVELLTAWSKGTPGALLTREAEEALQRLAKRVSG